MISHKAEILKYLDGPQFAQNSLQLEHAAFLKAIGTHINNHNCFQRRNNQKKERKRKKKGIQGAGPTQANDLYFSIHTEVMLHQPEERSKVIFENQHKGVILNKFTLRDIKSGKNKAQIYYRF